MTCRICHKELSDIEIPFIQGRESIRRRRVCRECKTKYPKLAADMRKVGIDDGTIEARVLSAMMATLKIPYPNMNWRGYVT